MTSDIQYILVNTASETSWTDDVPAIASGLIALLALFTTLYQSHLMRKHNRLSVKPHIAIHSEEDDNIFTITIKNDGLGPATIESLNFYRNNALVPGTGEKLIIAAFEGLERCNLTSLEAINTPFVLPVSHTIEMVKLEFDITLDSMEDYLNENLHLKIEYRSIYDETFHFDSKE